MQLEEGKKTPAITSTSLVTFADACTIQRTGQGTSVLLPWGGGSRCAVSF